MTPKDPEYRRIVRTAQCWRDRIQNDPMSDADMAEFDAWLAENVRHQEIYEQAEIYWAAFDHFKPEDVDDKYRCRSLSFRLADLAQNTKSLFATTQFKLVAAAAALALVTTPILLTQLPQDPVAPATIPPMLASYSANVGETVTITLDDGTVATLGADTQIETEFDPDKRIVRLASGAVLFEVAPDPARPFSVESERLTATVLGTIFEVRSNGGITRVGVAEGRVRVAHPYMIGEEPTRLMTQKELSAGEQIAATQTRGLRDIETVNPERVGAWRNEMLIYKGATLAEIVADANRYSAKDIRLDNIPADIAASEINVSFRASDIDGMIGALPDLYPVIIEETGETEVRIRPRP
ncbi:MAG: FecR domain-containing protein [Pseudomonadota bacterium]